MLGAWRYCVSAGLVGPVLVFCDCVEWEIESVTSFSVWQHVQLSDQVRPLLTLTCCWDVTTYPPRWPGA